MSRLIAYDHYYGDFTIKLGIIMYPLAKPVSTYIQAHEQFVVDIEEALHNHEDEEDLIRKIPDFITGITLTFFFIFLLLFLTGCSTIEKGQVSIIEQLNDVGCHITQYKERYGKQVTIQCTVVEF